MTSADLKITYAEDLAAQAIRIDLNTDQMLAVNPQCCTKGGGYGVAVDVYAAVMILMCRKCRRPCAAFRIASKIPAS